MLRIAHADDHAIMRHAMAQFMLGHPSIMLVAQVPSGTELIESLNRITADIVLADWHMPGMDGCELVTTIRGRFPLLPIVIHSASDDIQTRSLAMEAGASGFISKQSSPRQLLKAILNAA